MEWTHLYNSGSVLRLSKDHELAKKESVSFQEACSCPGGIQEGFYINERVRQRMKENGVEPDIWMETSQLHTHQKSDVIPGWLRGISSRDAVRMDDQICAIPTGRIPNAGRDRF